MRFPPRRLAVVPVPIAELMLGDRVADLPGGVRVRA